MNEIPSLLQNDHDKDVEKGNLSKQTSVDTPLDMHAHENEEKDVRRGVLHEEKHETRRGKSKADMKHVESNKFIGQEKEYIVLYNQSPQNFLQGARNAGLSDDEVFNYESETPAERNAFVKKVMLILMVMLLVTIAFITIVLITPVLKLIFAKSVTFITVPCAVGLMAIMYAMTCSACTRKPPCNYICLVIVVILYSLLLSAVTANYDTVIIAIAFGTTVACVGLCVGLALTKFDFTKWILYVAMLAMAVAAFGLIILILHVAAKIHLKGLDILYAALCTLVNVVMLTIELQQVLGGKSIELSTTDYALGAYMLYTSLISLFLNLLSLAGNISSLTDD